MIIPNIWENKKCSKPPTRQLDANFADFNSFWFWRMIEDCPNIPCGMLGFISTHVVHSYSFLFILVHSCSILVSFQPAPVSQRSFWTSAWALWESVPPWFSWPSWPFWPWPCAAPAKAEKISCTYINLMSKCLNVINCLHLQLSIWKYVNIYFWDWTF